MYWEKTYSQRVLQSVAFAIVFRAFILLFFEGDAETPAS